MATQFSIPSRTTPSVLSMDYFRGVDLYNASTNVHTSRSPEAPNMIRDEVGKVRKRMGWATVTRFGAQINGVFTLNGKRIIHAGTVLYAEGDGANIAGATAVEGYHPIRVGMNDQRSRAVQMGEKLYILDGKNYMVYDGKTAEQVSDHATVPTVIIGRSPTGGGTSYEAFNLIGRWWSEMFLGTADDKVYQLTTAGLDSDTVKVELLQANGTWVSKTEGTDFTVNRTTGKVTFTTAPGASPVTGMDNVKITAAKTRTDYAQRICRCDVAAVYGVQGSPDRLFVTGDPEHPNLDYYSGYNDPTFFGDTSYCQLGQDDASVAGYTVIGNYLAAHKSNGSDGRNVILRSGSLDSNGEAVFPIVNTTQGEGAVGKHAFATLGSEPLFLTRRGVYAVTNEYLTGEKYSQQRSLYLSNDLQEYGDRLEDATAIVWRDFYILSVGGKAYLLDGLQKDYAKDAPYSNFQYECYVCDNVPARVWFAEGDALCFGTEDGRLCRFHTAVDDPESYNDDGVPIRAYWDTPDLSGQYFWKNKTFRYISTRLAAAPVTGVQILAQVRGIWSKIFDAGEKARYFDWSYINFAKFVFSADRTPRTVGGKIKLKKVDKVRFRFLNEELNEPFGLYAVGFEFTEPGGRYKG